MSGTKISIKFKQPNAEIENCLIKWLKEAKKNDLRSAGKYSIALKSIRKYPLPIRNIRDCKILKGFGIKLCQMLENELQFSNRIKQETEKSNIENLISNVISKYELEKNDNSVSCEINISKNESLTDLFKEECSSLSHHFSTNFEIILLIDNQEIARLGNKRGSKDLQIPINYQVTNLKLGDYLWIFKDNELNSEYILPFIIERKRIDDLGKSIKDGRFREQKFRLKQCGLSHLIYLIEDISNKKHTSLPLSSLYQASINTLIQDGFIITFTTNSKETNEYLVSLHNLIIKFFNNTSLTYDPLKKLIFNQYTKKSFPLIRYEDFNLNNKKLRQFTIKDLFIKQLLQIKGISVERAQSIVEKYKTPRLLYLTIKEKDSQIINEITNIKYGETKKNIGPKIAQIIYQLYKMENLI